MNNVHFAVGNVNSVHLPPEHVNSVHFVLGHVNDVHFAVARRSQRVQGMETCDLSAARLRGENEIDNAIYAVLCAAFGEDEEEPIRRAVRLRLCAEPTPLQIIDAVCAELRCRGRLAYEEQRRLQATHVLAAFLDLPLAEREDVSLMVAV